MSKYTTKQKIALFIVFLLLLSTSATLLGIWGVIHGDVVWQFIGTSIVLACGSLATIAVLDRYFTEPSNEDK